MWRSLTVWMALCGCASAQPFAIDGTLDEWATSNPIATDPIGDAPRGMDAIAIRAIGRGSMLWMTLEIAEPANLQAGEQDDPTLRIELASGDRAATIDLRQRRAIDGQGRDLTWRDLAYVALPSYASTNFEFRIDLGAIGIGEGDEVSINLSGSDRLDAPATIVMGPPIEQRTDWTLQRHPGAGLRIASLNTERNGLRDPTRAGPFRRLLDLADADVYVFQEEWATSDETLRRRMREFDPLGDGRDWAVHKIGGCVIATGARMIPAWSFDSSYAAAIVDLGDRPEDGMAALVICVHLKCCGYAGSEEDDRRVRQAAEIRRTISELRAGRMGDDLLPYREAPAVILGDWNLVGSRRPLDELTGPTLPAFQPLDVRRLGSRHAWTWQTQDGVGFPPGRLDFVVFDSAGLVPRLGAAIGEDPATPLDLDRLGLRAGDLDASDHSMVIADFGFVAPGDPDRDDQTDE